MVGLRKLQKTLKRFFAKYIVFGQVEQLAFLGSRHVARSPAFEQGLETGIFGMWRLWHVFQVRLAVFTPAFSRHSFRLRRPFWMWERT